MIRTKNLIMTSGIKNRLAERGREWRMIIRIDWKSGLSIVEVRRISEGYPMSACRGFEMMATLSSNLKVREIKALVEDIQPVITEARQGWVQTIDRCGNIKAHFQGDSLDAVLAIRDRIDEWNCRAEIR
jgi:hypothetical protein